MASLLYQRTGRLLLPDGDVIDCCQHYIRLRAGVNRAAAKHRAFPFLSPGVARSSNSGLKAWKSAEAD